MTAFKPILVGVPAIMASEPLLNAKQVAAILNVPYKRVYELDIPAVRLAARSLRWRTSDVQQWIERRITR
jgi:predicted DNA-binding transcriptional regulator AlpA